MGLKIFLDSLARESLERLDLSSCDRLTRQPTRTPTMLEIKAAGNTVYIEQFPHQVQSKTKAALHGGEINLPQGHATGCNKFLPKGTATSDLVTAVSQGGDQRLLLLLAEIGPATL
jgi:hypothetical protein